MSILGQIINGRPFEAVTGSNSNVMQALDGQPAAIMGAGGSKGASSGVQAPMAANAPAAPASANGITPTAAGLGAAAILGAGAAPPANPLNPQPAASTPPTANFNNVANPQASNNPLQTTQPNQAPDQFAGTPFSQDNAPTVMARIQHPQFQSFLQSLGNYQ